MDWNNNAWENTAQDSYTYNANNNKTIYLSQFWLGNAWLDFTKTTFIYDANNRLISEIGINKFGI
jgi:hypothetical protein